MVRVCHCMYFESWEAFINMGGHGLYVWLSYGVGLCVFMAALISPLVRRKYIMKEFAQLQRRKKGKQSTSENSTALPEDL